MERKEKFAKIGKLANFSNKNFEKTQLFKVL